MPQVILVRLVPMKPTSGATFSSYLTNLSIRAFDLSFGNSADGTLVGQAQGAWVPNVGINASARRSPCQPAHRAALLVP